MSAPRLLLLGGTTEALALAEHLARDPRLEVISSLAGRTVAHRLPAGRVRVGGFGGAAGLQDFLAAEAITLVIDATHPFAATISRHAARSCETLKLPRLQLLRPPWQPRAGDRWLDVPDMAAAAASLPGLADTAFLAVGRQELAAFSGLETVHLVVRMIEAPSTPLPLARHTTILARGPFALADEVSLLTRHRIGALVSKNSGGPATAAKLEAARTLNLPVVLTRRPEAPQGPRAETVEAALAWLEEQLAPISAGEQHDLGR